MSAAMWGGPVQAEGTAMFQRCLEAGITALRAAILGDISSRKDGWVYRRTLAAKWHCSVRTVQRAITQAKQEGLLAVHRAKKGEIPPGATHARESGFSHRFTIGWGKAGEAVKRAVEQYRAFRLAKKVAVAAAGGKPTAPPRPARPEYQKRKWTPEELLAELDRVDRLRKPPDD